MKRSAPRLRAAEARELVDADAKYKRLKRETETAKLERDRLIAKAQAKIGLGDWVTSGGWTIRITMQRSGSRFSLSEYVKAGYKVTAAMRRFMSPESEYPRLWVERDGRS